MSLWSKVIYIIMSSNSVESFSFSLRKKVHYSATTRLHKRCYMPFSRLFKLTSIILATFVAFSFAAKKYPGIVRSRLGDIEIRKNGIGGWNAVRVGAKVHEGDLFRTNKESEIVFSLRDGSSISVEEKSIIAVTELIYEDGKAASTIDIYAGKIRFDVKKLAYNESSFKFKTGTAVATTRGAEGIIGRFGSGQLVAALRSGRLDIQVGDSSSTINAGQTAIFMDGKLIIQDRISSNGIDNFDEIENVLDDPFFVYLIRKTILEKDSFF